MAVQKCVLFFKDGGAGWSETYYLRDVDGDPDSSRQAVEELARIRQSLLARGDVQKDIQDTYIQAMRVSNVDAPQVSALFPSTTTIKKANGTNPIGTMGTRTANVNVFSAGKLHRRTLQLRGLPVTWVQGDLNERRSNKQTANLSANLNLFQIVLTQGAIGGGGRWALKTRAWDLATNPFISAVAIGTGGYWQITSNVTPGLSVGDRISIRGGKGRGLVGLNREAWVRAVLPTTGQYLLSTRPCAACDIDVKVPARIYRPGAVTYEAITEFIFSGYSQRETGRAFFRPPGHQRNKQQSRP